MARGPKGEYRPTDPIKSAMLMMRIATGEITEEEARKLAPKKSKPRHKPKKRSK
jgi:hypothetical protein